MRISLKYKLPLVILLTFVIYALLMMLYYRFFMFDRFKVDFEIYQDQLFKVSDDVSKGIAKQYPDNGKIRQFILNESSDKNIKISVFNIGGEKEFDSDLHKNNNVSAKLKNNVIVDGKVVYITEIQYPYAILKFINIYLDSKNNFIAFTVALISLLLLIFFFHISIVKPLTNLQSNLNKVKYKGNVFDIPSNRNDEIGDLYRNFNEMVKRLELSYEQQTEMISSVSHDLRTPLTSIMGYVERLANSNQITDEKKQEYYKIIYKKAQDIEKLTDDFLNYSKNEQDLMIINKEEVNLKDFITAICKEYYEELQAFNAELEYEIHVKDSVSMKADINKLRRVFANLISNSLKYVDNEKVKVKINCNVKNNEVLFSVEDNGQGVPVEELSFIFNSFYRIDKSRSREKGGIGLGLAICKRIIESHNGKIWASNTVNGGLAVSFTLPLI